MSVFSGARTAAAVSLLSGNRSMLSTTPSSTSRPAGSKANHAAPTVIASLHRTVTVLEPFSTAALWRGWNSMTCCRTGMTPVYGNGLEGLTFRDPLSPARVSAWHWKSGTAEPRQSRTDPPASTSRRPGPLRLSGTSDGSTEAINGRLEHLRASALGFHNLTHYIARSLLETGGFRPHPRPLMR